MYYVANLYLVPLDQIRCLSVQLYFYRVTKQYNNTTSKINRSHNPRIPGITFDPQMSFSEHYLDYLEDGREIALDQ